MIKPHYEIYRYTTKICEAEGQSIVECRLAGGEIGNILAVRAKATPIECACLDGEVKYKGKLVLTVVYEDTERQICRAERGAEFSHRVERSEVAPSFYAAADFDVENVSWKREGSGVYLSAVVNAKFRVYGNAQSEYLYDGEGLIVKRENQPIVKTVTAQGEAEADDEFEIDFVGDILMHGENAHLSFVEAQAGKIALAGEIALNVCALKEDGNLCSYERLIPFRAEISCEESLPAYSASATVRVKNAVLSATTDEERGKCKVEAEIDLAFDCELFISDELPMVADTYSAESELTVKTETRESRYCSEVLNFTERVSGVASLSEAIDYSTALKAALLPRAEIVVKPTESGGEAEGAIFAEVVLKDADGAHKSARLSLPFVFPLNVGAGKIAEAEAIVCGLSARQRKEGEAEAEATLKVTVRTYETATAKYVKEIEIGEAIAENECAVSVYLPREGDGLWETAKRLRRTPEELEKSNPDLKFPLQKDERIFVYRQKT